MGGEGEKNKKNKKGKTLFVGSLAKSLQVLRAFDSGHRELGITEISRVSGLEKSGANRIIRTLHDLGYLHRNPHSRKYALTAQVLSNAYNFLRANPIIEVAMPRLVGLSDELSRSVTLCMLVDTDIIYAVRLERREFYHPTGHIGERQPAYCTSGGRAILSKLARPQVLDILERSDLKKMTPLTKTGVDELLEELKIADRKSYCLQAGEFIRNEINLAAPIMDVDSQPVAAIVISQLYRENESAAMEKEFAPLLLQTANEISSALGAPHPGQ